MTQTVVVGIDHSLHAEYAVRYYLDKMHRPGNKLVLVHGIELPEMTIQNARDHYVSPAVLASMWKEEEAKSKALENKMKILIKDREVSARLRSHVGKPGEVVCHFAVEEKAAFIVIGSRGVSALKRAVLGTVSDYILRHANCPVVVCRDPVDVNRQRSRHASADSSNQPLTRADSVGEDHQKIRHKSGEPLSKITSSIRRRFKSGGRAAQSVDFPNGSAGFEYETVTVLYPEQGDAPQETSTTSVPTDV